MPRRAKDDHIHLARLIRADIEKLAQSGGTEADVVKLFADAKATPALKGDAFYVLDSQPGGFINYGYPNDTGWHSLLRRTRNHPAHGKAMFAVFRGE